MPCRPDILRLDQRAARVLRVDEPVAVLPAPELDLAERADEAEDGAVRRAVHVDRVARVHDDAHPAPRARALVTATVSTCMPSR